MFKLGIVDSGKASVDLLTGLEAYLSLDADTNPEPDATGNGYTGALNGPTYTSSGFINGAYSFDGTGDHISINNYTSLYPGTGDYAISAWFYWEQAYDLAQFDPVIATRDADGASNGAGFNIYVNYTAVDTVQISSQWGDGSNVTNAYGVVRSNYYQNWTHFVAVRDTTEGKIKTYTNGVLDKNVTDNTGNISSFNETLKIGRSDTGVNKYFTGKIDEVGLWKGRALGQDEVTALYNGGSGLPYSSFT